MKTLHAIYGKCIRPRLNPIQQQRFKLLVAAWGYAPILFISRLSLGQRVNLIIRCLRVDWCVQHAHWPGEIARVIKAIATRQASPGEVVVEAGCWQGGSTAKLSIVARMLGYKLLVFDSFQGVEQIPSNYFSGKYAAGIELVQQNVRTFGEIQVCEFVPGWFSETLQDKPVPNPVRVVYVDCDLAKGTQEVLSGVLPSLTDDAVVFSQDYHIREVKDLLDDESTWNTVGTGKTMSPAKRYRYRQLAAFAHQDGS